MMMMMMMTTMPMTVLQTTTSVQVCTRVRTPVSTPWEASPATVRPDIPSRQMHAPA